MNFLGWSIALAISAVGLLSPAHAQSPIRVVVDEWAPFGGENLTNGGISLDVISTVLIRAGYDVTTEIVPFERALMGAQQGDYDIVGNLFYDADLTDYLSYGDPFFETEVRFVRRIGTAADFTDIDSLIPHSIAVGAGYLYSPEFDRSTSLRKTTVTTVQQGLRMVAAGRADLTLDSFDVLSYLMNVAEPALAAQLEILPNPLASQQIHMGVRSDLVGREQIIADFNRILAEMQADGSLDALLAQHRYDN